MAWMWQSILRQPGIVIVATFDKAVSECRLNGLEQIGRDVRKNTKPGLERKSRLVEQQAEPIHGDATPLPRRGQKRSLKRCIDQISDQCRRCQTRQIDIE